MSPSLPSESLRVTGTPTTVKMDKKLDSVIGTLVRSANSD